MKVQYPEVAGWCGWDVRNLRTLWGLWRAGSRTSTSGGGERDRIAGALELDFEREAEMTRRIKANLIGCPGSFIPRVIDDHVAKKVVVTEYSTGRGLLDRERREARDTDPVAFAKTVARPMATRSWLMGCSRPTPTGQHPGAAGPVCAGLLDFGLTEELPVGGAARFARLVIATGDRDRTGSWRPSGNSA